MIRYGWFVALAGAALMIASPAVAQKRSLLRVPPDTKCQLHLIVSDRVVALSENILVGRLAPLLRGGVDDEENLSKLKRSIDAPAMMTAIAELNLPERLKMPVNTVVIPHPEALTRQQLSAKTRQPGKEIPCYVELVLTELAYDQHAILGGLLSTTFQMHTYVAGKRIYATNRWIYGKAGLLGKSGSDPAKIREQIIDAFKVNVIEFVNTTQAPLLRRKPPSF